MDIAYSPDGTRLAVSSTIGVWIYDTETGEELHLLFDENSRLGGPAFSPDGNTIATGIYAFSPDGNTIGVNLAIFHGVLGTIDINM